ncbi:efflux RND transporter periplasmic adaptor subunit [Humibacter antri]
MGYVMRSNTAAAIAAASKPVSVYKAAEERELQLTPVTGTIAPVSVFDYSPPPGAFTGQPVVTQVGVAAGQAITAGSLLVALDDRPIFALSLAITPWRDFALGQSGSDVKSLNDELDALGLRSSGASDSYDSATARAIRELFSRAHFEALGTPAGTSLPLANVALLPTGSFVVTTQTPLGSSAATGKPVIEGSQAANQVVSKIDILHKQHVSVGTVVSIQVSGGGSKPATGQVESIGAFTAGDSSKSGAAAQSGYPVVISFAPGSAGSAAAGGDQVSIGFPNSIDRRLAIPTIAIEQSGAQPWVLVKRGLKDVRAEVTPVWQQNGWTGIQTQSALKPGDRVLVSGR